MTDWWSRCRWVAEPGGGLSVGDAIGSQQEAPRLYHVAMRQHRTEPYLQLVTLLRRHRYGADAIPTGILRRSPPCYFIDAPLGVGQNVDVLDERVRVENESRSTAR